MENKNNMHINKIKNENFFKMIKISDLVEKVIPKPSIYKIKTQNGVVGVFGGSFEYTGAPFYSAVSALKSGVDLSHIFCHADAATPIKSYSPELIVHPGFDNNIDNSSLLNKTIRWFKSMDILLYGPGLGREEPTPYVFNLFLSESIKIKNMMHVLDADSLWHFMNSDYKNFLSEDCFFIFTPNKTEFGRLYKMYFNKDYASDDSTIDNWLSNMNIRDDIKVIQFEDLDNLEYNNSDVFQLFKAEIELAKLLKNKIIIKKGRNDTVTDGKMLFVIFNEGSLKRTGGLGDILGGLISAYCAMIKKEFGQSKEIKSIHLMEAISLASYVCRLASKNAYSIHGFSLTAPDVILELAKIAKDYKI